MYICTCVYMYICNMYTCVSPCPGMFLPMAGPVNCGVRIRIRVCTYILLCIHVYAYTCIYVNMCICIYVYMCIYVHL